jgi:hypothetical protein
LFVRGRVIGCLLMGSTDSRRTLGVDVWLYENIALQLALAVGDRFRVVEDSQMSEARDTSEFVELTDGITVVLRK